MKSTRKLVTAAMCAAISAVLLLIGRYSPTGQAGFAAAASVFIAAVVIECGFPWGIMAFAVSSALGFAAAPQTGIWWIYTIFLGYYPILRMAADKLPAVPRFVCKLAVFGIALFALTRLINMPAIMTKNTATWCFGILVLTAVFVVFDIGYGKLILYYKTRFRFRRR